MFNFNNNKDNLNEILPPGQYKVKNWPVLTAAKKLNISDDDWVLEITGLVDNPVKLTLQDIYNMTATVQVADFHCVTTWSMLNTNWKGLAWSEIEKLVKPKQEAKYVLQYSNDEIEYTTGLPLVEYQKPHVILAYEHDGNAIPVEHGGPIRLLIPHIYAYKSAKWLKKIEFLPEKKLGFWEERGYSEQADPWKEQRYTEDDDV